MDANMTRKQWYLSHGICVACGQRDAFEGRQKCPECLEKAANNNAKYRSLDRERSYYPRRKAKRDARIAAGLCPNCGKPAVYGQLCLRHYVKKQLVHEKEKQIRLQRGDSRRERVQNGMCWFCDTPALEGMKVCEYHYADIMKRFHGKRGGESHPWTLAESARIEEIRNR